MRRIFITCTALFLTAALWAQETTESASIPKLVDLGASKCIPCKKMAPILEELKTQYSGVFEVVFIDVWQQENSRKAAQYNIQSIPTQIFLDKDGMELARHVGFISKEDILAQWKSLGYNFEPKSAEIETAQN